MVSKLLLATQENFIDVYNEEGMTSDAEKLVTYYRDIKAGIEVDKTPEDYGAFPTEAYSHTPSFAGVQQPGMTGQVKEDILSRFGELGVTVKNGQLSFDPVLLSKEEFLSTDQHWSLAHRQNLETTPSLTLAIDMIGFTTLTVPVIYVLSDEEKMIVTDVSGKETVYQGHAFDVETSQMLFGRHHDIDKITVSVDQSKLV